MKMKDLKCVNRRLYNALYMGFTVGIYSEFSYGMFDKRQVGPDEFGELTAGDLLDLFGENLLKWRGIGKTGYATLVSLRD